MGGVYEWAVCVRCVGVWVCGRVYVCVYMGMNACVRVTYRIDDELSLLAQQASNEHQARIPDFVRKKRNDGRSDRKALL